MRGYWLAWAVAALAGTVYLAATLTKGDKSMFVPGRTTAGHYQIEMECASCHTPFQGVTDLACVRCHGDELAVADDSHPKSKFTDPRNADRVKLLDATSCVTCHREHNPGITRPMGVTLPDDYCVLCHSDVGKDRPSHAGMTFDTCASAGCHNYHDNTALYEDFLAKHAREPALLPRPMVSHRTSTDRLTDLTMSPGRGLSASDHDAPAGVPLDPVLLTDWTSTAHARAGVNCSGCHRASSPDRTGKQRLNDPTERDCAVCHESEVQGFLGGRHGMRVAAGLPPMRPGLARLPMKPGVSHLELTCSSCHTAHRFDTRRASVEACLTCHNDRHSLAFLDSPHYRLWKNELTQIGRSGTGVSCATCHLPRERRKENGVEGVFVQHNQNANLRPNEKMARSVCMSCHGLQFTLDALADSRLIEMNFNGRPAQRVNSVEMATRRTNNTN